ncbi:MAG: hypothetical protein C0478_02540 [Planctomyces sp.]|nr:hypothetical protein [Planctomyces sp.]
MQVAQPLCEGFHQSRVSWASAETEVPHQTPQAKKANWHVARKPCFDMCGSIVRSRRVNRKTGPSTSRANIIGNHNSQA